MSILHDYQFVQKVYADSQFNICRAIRKSDRTLVLIKTINSELSSVKNSWLENEYQITQNLSDSGIIKPCSLKNYYDSLVIILEDFAGENLTQFIQYNSVTIADFLAIAIRLVEVLQKIHQHQIIHQNIQPSSIFIDPKTLKIKITNFSIATNGDRSSEFSAQLELANLAYISPEQTERTNLAVDYRTDFYSLGIVFYEILTGQLPCTALDCLELMHCHLTQIPNSPRQLKPDISETLSAIVMKLIAKNPEDRYQNTYGIIADLKACQTNNLSSDPRKPFICGKFDRYGQFTISSRLYGRDDAVKILQSSLNRVDSGTTQITLVKGSSGIGKTTFIEKIIKANIRSQDYLITGKCEQLTSNIPYGVIIQAFSSLIQQLLTESPESLQVWRTKIMSAVETNGKVITAIFPDLELIIGLQPDIPKLSAKETQNRFNNLFIEFVKVFACREHPLILCLDDLQWVDSASLQLLEFLSNNFYSGHLLIVGAYRDDEFSGDRPLSKTIERIGSSLTVNEITLGPLSIDDIDRLLTDSLDAGQHTLPLAKLLFDRTQGNPFFLNRLLQTLYSEKLIAFDFEHLVWQWQIEQIQHTAIVNCNVVDLVIDNLVKLSTATQNVLKIAACIGDRFDLATCAIAGEFTLSRTARELDYALQAGIILPARQPNSYRFLNPRVCQTAYSMLNEIEKIHIHLKIGHYLLRQTNPNQIEEQIFNLVKHFNISKMFFWLSSFALRVAEFNLIAAKRAKAAIAYEVAANYLNIALELLAPFSWSEHYNLKLSIFLEAAEIQYLLTNFSRAEQLGDIVLAQAKSVLTKIEVYQIKIHACIAQNKMQLAIDLGLDTLELLKISFSEDSTYRSALQARLKSDRPLDELTELPQMSDPVSLAAMEILAIIIPPIQIVKPQLFPQIVLKMVSLSEQYGNCPLSAYAYTLYGLWLCGMGDIEAGYQLGKLAIALPKRLELKAIETKIEFIYNSMIRHWQEPAVSTLESFLTGIEAGIRVGDIEHACFHAQYYCTYLFLVGEPLASASKRSLTQINLIQGFKQYFQLNYARLWRQLNLNLQRLAKDRLLLIGESFDESKMVPLWHKTNNATSLFAYYLAKLILCCFFQDYRQGIVNGDRGKQYLNTAVGSMCYGAFYFYYPLALLAEHSRSEIESADLSQVKPYQLQLKQWAAQAPENYQHKYDLLTAEIARVSGDNELAAEYYDRAIVAAETAGYLHEAALAAELTGKFYFSLNRLKIARLYLDDACNKYQLWGALAKVEDLKQRYPQLLVPNQRDESIDPHHFGDRTLPPKHQTISERAEMATLDLFSVIKASQAISSEIVLDNLISKMMDIVMENAGAQKSILLLNQGSSLVIAASATVTSENKVVLPYASIADNSDVPTSIINYVQSTRSSIILDRATKEGIFTKDAYTIEHQPKSVLSCPIIYQNQLQGIIYLENSSIEAAFTPQKSKILQVLLFQVSISIENARLYRNLENHTSVRESLAQKEILLKEIHHRVKNNLLVVSSLLDLQSSYIDDDRVNKLLENCQNRITAMALVHQHLYGSSQLNKINLAQYIKSLVDNLAYLYGSQDRINLILEVEPIKINIESANPCGLIINELVSNALEHGFGDRDRGNIWLSLKANSQGENVLIIRDDGVGFKDGLDLYNSDSLGLELVCTLVEQIDGKIKLDRANGTKIEITFAELDYHSRI